MPPLDFFDFFFSNRKWCSFSHYTRSWGTLYLCHSGGIIFHAGVGVVWGVTGYVPLDFFFECKMASVHTLHILMDCIVPFPVEWFCFHVGGGASGSGGMPPLDFFHFVKLKMVFILTSCNALYLFLSSGIISM